MQGSKRWRWSGHHRYIDWKKIRKRFNQDFVFSNEVEFRYSPHHELAQIIFNNKVIWRGILFTPYFYKRRGKADLVIDSQEFFRTIEDYWNCPKSQLIDYKDTSFISTGGFDQTPIGLNEFVTLLKVIDKRIGVRRLQKMYFDMFFNVLLEGEDRIAIKILQHRIKRADIPNPDV